MVARPPGLLSRISAAVRRALPGPAAQRRNYGAAQNSRLTEGWSSLNTSANADLHRSLDTLRARSRQLGRDNDYAVKFLRLVTTNVVGNGFMLQARVYDEPGKPDSAANDAVEIAFAEWCRPGACEVTGRHSLRDLCNVLVRATARDGEFLVRKVRGASARNPFGFALQLLDVDRIDTLLNRVADTTRNAVRMGVEIDSYGRPVNYWLREGHPGDMFQAGGATANRHLIIPADEIIHGFMSDRPEQLRGLPWMHASMLRMNHLAGYEESAVVAARVGASKMGFFTTPDGQAFPAATATEGDAGGTDERLMMDADPGVFQSLPEGVSFQPFNPDYPTAMYADFVKANLRGIASGLGVAYHALANDLEGVSFSSIRSGTLEERDHWSVVQQWFIDAFLEPIYTEWLRNALAFGQVKLASGSTLSLAKFDKFKAHLWQPRRWEWVDPLKDIEADLKAVESGFKAPQDIAAKLGLDYEDVLVKITQAQALRDRLGVKLGPLFPPPAPAAAPAPDPAAADAATANRQATDDLARSIEAGVAALHADQQRHLGALTQLRDSLAEQSRALIERPIVVNLPQPVINLGNTQVDVHLPAQRATERIPVRNADGVIEKLIERPIEEPST